MKNLTSNQLNRLNNRIDYLEDMARYLAFNPSEDFILSEKERLDKISESINARFKIWCIDVAPKNIDPKKYRSIFNKDTGLTKVKKQLKTIQFILG